MQYVPNAKFYSFFSESTSLFNLTNTCFESSITGRTPRTGNNQSRDNRREKNRSKWNPGPEDAGKHFKTFIDDQCHDEEIHQNDKGGKR